MAIIEVCNLTKNYDFGRVRGVDNISFSVNEGELFGFIGPNGAGKSTTIRILMNFIHPDSGTAHINGLDCRSRSREIKKFTGYMPSDVRFYPAATVSELLDYACGMRKIKKGCWKELAEYYELDAGKKFRELSLGNRRKLSIIQAMMFSPALLILDEPTGGLDPLMQEKFFDALTEARNRGTTVFFSSHNLGEVQKYCNRVALVKDGHIAMMPDRSAISMYSVEIETNADCCVLLESLHASGIRRHRNRLYFMIPGDMLSELTKALAQIELHDLVIAKPSLEQQFHDTFSKEEGGA